MQRTRQLLLQLMSKQPLFKTSSSHQIQQNQSNLTDQSLMRQLRQLALQQIRKSTLENN